METTIEIFGQTVKTKGYIIKIDRSKFTTEELQELEQFRQLAIRLKVVGRMLDMKYQDAESKREKNQWYKCVELMDELKSVFDDELFAKFPQLPDSAVHCFY